MAGEVEDVGGIGISLEITDNTDKELTRIEDRLKALVRSWSIAVDVDSSSPGRGGSNPPAQNQAEAKVAAAFSAGIDKFTAALGNLQIAIDPKSISLIASAIREALNESRPGATGTGSSAPGYQNYHLDRDVATGTIVASRSPILQSNEQRSFVRALTVAGGIRPSATAGGGGGAGGSRGSAEGAGSNKPLNVDDFWAKVNGIIADITKKAGPGRAAPAADIAAADRRIAALTQLVSKVDPALRQEVLGPGGPVAKYESRKKVGFATAGYSAPPAAPTPQSPDPEPTVRCGTCGGSFKPRGLATHMRMAHQPKPAASPPPTPTPAPIPESGPGQWKRQEKVERPPRDEDVSSEHLTQSDPKGRKTGRHIPGQRRISGRDRGPLATLAVDRMFDISRPLPRLAEGRAPTMDELGAVNQAGYQRTIGVREFLRGQYQDVGEYSPRDAKLAGTLRQLEAARVVGNAERIAELEKRARGRIRRLTRGSDPAARMRFAHRVLGDMVPGRELELVDPSAGAFGMGAGSIQGRLAETGRHQANVAASRRMLAQVSAQSFVESGAAGPAYETPPGGERRVAGTGKEWRGGAVGLTEFPAGLRSGGDIPAVFRQVLEEYRSGKIGPAYRLLTPEAVAPRVPGTASLQAKTERMRGLRLPISGPGSDLLQSLMGPAFDRLSRLRAPTLPSGPLQGQALFRVSGPERIREELVSRLGLESADELRNNPQLASLMDDLTTVRLTGPKPQQRLPTPGMAVWQRSQTFAREEMPFPMAIFDKEGKLVREAMVRRDRARVTSRRAMGERVQRLESRRRIRKDIRAGGGVGQRFKGVLSERDLNYVDSILQRQDEGKDISFSDAAISKSLEKLYLYQLGPVDQRKRPEDKLLPEVSSRDIIEHLYGRHQAPGETDDSFQRRGGYQAGLLDTLHKRYGRKSKERRQVAPMASALLRAVRTQVGVEARFRKTDAMRQQGVEERKLGFVGPIAPGKYTGLGIPAAEADLGAIQSHPLAKELLRAREAVALKETAEQHQRALAGTTQTSTGAFLDADQPGRGPRLQIATLPAPGFRTGEGLVTDKAHAKPGAKRAHRVGEPIRRELTPEEQGKSLDELRAELQDVIERIAQPLPESEARSAPRDEQRRVAGETLIARRVHARYRLQRAEESGDVLDRAYAERDLELASRRLPEALAGTYAPTYNDVRKEPEPTLIGPPAPPLDIPGAVANEEPAPRRRRRAGGGLVSIGGPTTPVPPTAGGSGGTVTLGGQPIRVIVADVEKASAIEAAIAKIKVAGGSASDNAAERLSTAAAPAPEFARGFVGPVQPQYRVPVVPETQAPEFAKGFVGPARPEYQKPVVPEIEAPEFAKGFIGPPRPELVAAKIAAEEKRQADAAAALKEKTDREAAAAKTKADSAAKTTAREAAAAKAKADREAAVEKSRADREAAAAARARARLPIRQKLVENQYDSLHSVAAEHITGLDQDEVKRERLRGLAEAKAEPQYQDLLGRAAEAWNAIQGRPEWAGAPRSSLWMETRRQLEKTEPGDLFGEGETGQFRRDLETKLGLNAAKPPTAKSPARTREQTLYQRIDTLAARAGVETRNLPSRSGQQSPASIGYGTDEEGQPLTLDDYISGMRASRQAAEKSLPMRALSTSAIQTVGTLFGPYENVRKKALEAAKKESTFKTQADILGQMEAEHPIKRAQLEETRTKLQARVAAGETQYQPDIDAATSALTELTDSYEAQKEVVTKSKEAYETANKQVVTAGDSVRHFGASFVGGVAGGFIGAMAGMLAQPLIQAVSVAVEKIGGPMMDQALGFTMTRQRTMGQLAQATEAAGGIGSVAYAQTYRFAPQEATDQFAAKVTSQAEIIAANKQFESYRDLYRTAKGLPEGAAPALISSQGPLGNPFMADYKSTSELIGSEFRAGAYFRPTSTTGEMMAPRLTKDSQKIVAENQLWANAVNDILGKENKYQLRAGSVEEIAQAQGNMQLTGLGGVAAGGFVAVDAATGKLVSSFEELMKVVTSVGTSFTRVDPKQFMAAQAPQMQAQISQMQWQRDYQLNTINPLQRSLALLQQPLLPAGTGIMPYAGQSMYESVAGLNAPIGPVGVPQGVSPTGGMSADAYTMPPAAQRGIDEYWFTLSQLRMDIQLGAGEARQRLLDFGIPASVVDSVEQYGKILAGAQAQIGDIQAARAETQYNRSLFLANRALTDARQLSGQIGKTASNNVGYYERQLLLINRQNQALSLQLQRRQILTQLALARFQVPGETGEERYARRIEAEIGAGIQQRQLNLATQAFGTEIKLVDETNLRAVKDAAYTLQDLKASYEAGNKIAWLEQIASAAQQAQQSVMPDVSVWETYITGFKGYLVSIATELAATTGNSMVEMLKIVEGEVQKFVEKYPWITGIAASGGSSGNTSTSNPQGNYPGHGTIGTTSSGTQAATTVTQNTTVHRDERRVLIADGAVSIIVNTKTLDEEQVADLQRQVIGALNKAAQLIGLRPVAT